MLLGSSNLLLKNKSLTGCNCLLICFTYFWFLCYFRHIMESSIFNIPAGVLQKRKKIAILYVFGVLWFIANLSLTYIQLWAGTVVIYWRKEEPYLVQILTKQKPQSSKTILFWMNRTKSWLTFASKFVIFSANRLAANSNRALHDFIWRSILRGRTSRALFILFGSDCFYAPFLLDPISYSQLSPCGRLTIADNSLIRTAAKYPEKLNYRRLTEINSRAITDSRY